MDEIDDLLSRHRDTRRPSSDATARVRQRMLDAYDAGVAHRARPISGLPGDRSAPEVNPSDDEDDAEGEVVPLRATTPARSRLTKIRWIAAAAVTVIIAAVVASLDRDDTSQQALTVSAPSVDIDQLHTSCTLHVSALADALDLARVDPSEGHLGAFSVAYATTLHELRTVELTPPTRDRLDYAAELLEGALLRFDEQRSGDAAIELAGQLADALDPLVDAETCELERLAPNRPSESTFYDGFSAEG